jgi:hypothetical protein
MIKRVCVLVILMAGCSPFVKGTPVNEFRKGGAPIVQPVAEDGNYALYNVFETTPRATFPLRKGQLVGFKASTTGKIIAVAGNEQMELPEASYVWKLRPPKEEKVGSRQ